MRAPITIHVIDDDPWVLESFGQLLEAHGYDVGLHASGEAFLAECDLEALGGWVVVDLDLPGIAGLEILSLLRRRAPAVRTIAMTGRLDDQAAERSVANGASAFLHKPVSSRSLLALLAG